MSDFDQGTDDMKTRMAVLEREVGGMVGIFTRFDHTIEKFADMAMSLKEILAVHDQRLLERERTDLSLYDGIAKQADENKRTTERLHQRMEEFSKSITDNVRQQLDERNTQLLAELRRMSDDNKREFDKIESDLADHADSQERVTVDLEERIESLEKWRWIIAGAAGTLGFLIARWDFVMRLFGIG